MIPVAGGRPAGERVGCARRRRRLAIPTVIPAVGPTAVPARKHQGVPVLRSGPDASDRRARDAGVMRPLRNRHGPAVGRRAQQQPHGGDGDRGPRAVPVRGEHADHGGPEARARPRGEHPRGRHAAPRQGRVAGGADRPALLDRAALGQALRARCSFRGRPGPRPPSPRPHVSRRGVDGTVGHARRPARGPARGHRQAR